MPDLNGHTRRYCTHLVISTTSYFNLSNTLQTTNIRIIEKYFDLRLGYYRWYSKLKEQTTNILHIQHDSFNWYQFNNLKILSLLSRGLMIFTLKRIQYRSVHIQDIVRLQLLIIKFNILDDTVNVITANNYISFVEQITWYCNPSYHCNNLQIYLLLNIFLSRNISYRYYN